MVYANPTRSSEEFFLQTAHFASQARGTFELHGIPDELRQFIEDGDPLGLVGLDQLEKGVLTKGVQVGAQQLATIDAQSFIGPTYKIPYGQLFTDITIEFLLMNKDRETAGAIYYALTKWHEFIAGPAQTTIARSIRSDSTPFAVRYYDSYTAGATVSVFSPSSRTKPEIRVDLTEVYPMSIGSLITSWDQPDAPLTCQVSMAYHYMQVIDPSKG